MRRLNLIAEGQTEQAFAWQLLRSHLAGFGVDLAKPTCVKTSRDHRGGLLRYEHIRKHVCRWLTQDRDPTLRLTTMIDLYGLPPDFPESANAAKLVDPYARVECLETAWQTDVDDRRFIPYIQLHEFEAILLCQPAAFAVLYPAHDEQLENLRRLSAGFRSPELIDDGGQTAPSKRIAEQIPEYAKEKRSAGPVIANHIGLAVIRKQCPHFHHWLERLEALGGHAA
jgi:hypothetical protein